MPDRTRDTLPLLRKARRTATRVRLNAVAERVCTWGLFPVGYGIAALTLIKVLHPAAATMHALGWGFAVPGAAFIGGILVAAFKPAPPFAGALALDRAHELHDRITNALTFADRPAAELTPLMQAAIDDALAVATDVSPARAAPFRLPRDFVALTLLLVGALGVALLEVPVRRVIPPAPPHVDALVVAPDDAELFRKMGSDLSLATTDPSAAAGVRRFNQVVEDLAAHRLDRSEIFRRLDELERSMKDPLGIDPSARDEAFDGIAKELAKSGLSKPVADALSEKKLADAEQAMKDLAKKVADAKKDVDKARLEALRKSLEKAAETVKKRAGDTETAKRELEETRKRLLEKKNKQGLNKAEQQELERTERQLERLEREKAQNEAGQKSLSGLDKDLAKAAQDLMKDLGQGSQDLQQGAKDINRAGNQQMGEEQKKELLRKIEEMRQILRQEGQAGKERLKRMLQFGQAARGQGNQGEGKGGDKGSQPKPGSGQEGGQGKDGKGGSQLTLGNGSPGPGAGMALMPGGSQPSQGEPDPSKSASGSASNGAEWGTGHDPNLAGKATALKGHTEDSSETGADTGQGAAASQVIYGAAQRGFVGKGYKKVYTDYQTVAEESLGHDEIPSGYRFYIRRYFQLIRPRD